jgi:GntR family transcriptional regulator, rspAB operon transcriptional repressor
MAVQYRSAAELAAEEIRHRIYSGSFAPGVKLSIGDLASEMTLSTTPVREALKALEVEGLVTIAPRSGVYVREISLDEVAEVYAIKAALEPMMMRWAILRGTDEELDKIVRLAAQLAAYARDQRLDDYVRVVEERRQLLLDAARSDALISIFQAIDGRVRLLRYRNLAQQDRMTRSAHEHQALAQAVADRDVDRACALTVESVQGAARSLLHLLDETSEPNVPGSAMNMWSLVAELMRAEASGTQPVAAVTRPGRSPEPTVSSSPKGP